MDDKSIKWKDWEIVKIIGEGSFGRVYLIQKILVDGTIHKAALKVIRIPQKDSDVDEMMMEGYNHETITSTFDAHLQEIVSEYSLMSKMRGSANVVNCDDVDYVQHENGIGWDIYIKMELLTPLAKSLPEKFDEDIVLNVARDLSNALILCKNHNIVHRDIKPQNIFLSENGDYKLGDFGIAKTVEKTMGGTKIGTYKYMSPEIYYNKPFSYYSDVYSLGLVLYWLLNERRLPFMPLPPEKIKGNSETESRERRFSGEKIPDPKNGSKELKRIVLKACEFDIKERYQDGQELLNDVEKIIDERKREEELRKAEGEEPKAEGEEPKAEGEEPKAEGEEPKAEGEEPKAEGEELKTEGEEPKVPYKTKNIIKYLILIVVIGLILVFGLKSCDVSNESVAVQSEKIPDVSNLKQEEAVTKLESVGFVVEVIMKKSEENHNNVIEQKPAAGTEVDKGSVVTITVNEYEKPDSKSNSKSKKVKVPNVVGKNKSDAVKLLEEKGFEVTVKTKKTSDDNTNVLNQSPKGDTKAKKGSTVTITVNKYENKESSSNNNTTNTNNVNVPNVLGANQSDAVWTLKNAGFNVVINTKETTSNNTIVLSQSPDGDTKAKKGSTVTITVNKYENKEPSSNNNTTNTNNVNVPNVVGVNQSDAVRTLENAGFNVVTNTKETTSNNTNILSQSPTGNSKAKKGSTITITVNKYINPSWSGYVDELPSNITSGKYHIEKRTLYSYRDMKYTEDSSIIDGWTCYDSKSEEYYTGWSNWSGWTTDAHYSNDLKQVKTRTEWRYYAFVCPVCGGREPLQGKSDCGKYNLSPSNWTETWSPYSYSSVASSTYSYSKYKRHTSSLGDGLRWNFSASNLYDTAPGTLDDGVGSVVIRTAYCYRTREKKISTTYYLKKLGDWSDFNVTNPGQKDGREIRTKTQYRYKLK